MAEVIAKSSTFTLEASTDGGTTWTNIPGITDYQPGDETVEDIDVTDFDSSGDTREYASGFTDPGQGSMTLNFDSSNTIHQMLRNKNAGASLQIRETIDDEHIVHTIIIIGFNSPKAIGQIVTATVDFRRSGPAVITAVV